MITPSVVVFSRHRNHISPRLIIILIWIYPSWYRFIWWYFHLLTGIVVWLFKLLFSSISCFLLLVCVENRYIFVPYKKKGYNKKLEIQYTTKISLYWRNICHFVDRNLISYFLLSTLRFIYITCIIFIYLVNKKRRSIQNFWRNIIKVIANYLKKG